MRVVEHVAFQTQPLDAGEALGVDWGDATDAAELCKDGGEKKKTKQFSPRKRKEKKRKDRKSEIVRVTILCLRYALPLVIGSGRMAVEEVVAGVTQKLVIAGRAEQRRCTAAQVALGPFRRIYGGGGRVSRAHRLQLSPKRMLRRQRLTCGCRQALG